jgi:hypothetical protein
MGGKSRQPFVKKTTKPVRQAGKKANQAGGKVHMPAEYYGVDSGVYTPNPVAGYSAQDVPVSHGVTHNGVAGPSMTVTPLFMKGGCGCGFKPGMVGGKNKKSKKLKRSNKNKKAKRVGTKKSKRTKK